MAGNFDPYNKKSWFFGPLGRKETESLLNDQDLGVFLVRTSSTIPGDLVLCVKEKDKVSHYIINKVVQQGSPVIRFRIGDQMFPDITALLAFYMTTVLDTIPLSRPVERLDKLEKVIAKFDFPGNDNEDLPFKKGEILYIVSKPEEGWWMARNAEGDLGTIPVPYITPFVVNNNNECHSTDSLNLSSNFDSQLSIKDSLENGHREENHEAPSHPPPNIPSMSRTSQTSSPRTSEGEPQTYGVPHTTERSLPAKARVIKPRYLPYDNTALRLQIGDIITVTEINASGQWKGVLNGKTGHFPFTCIEWITDNGQEEGTSSQENHQHLQSPNINDANRETPIV